MSLNFLNNGPLMWIHKDTITSYIAVYQICDVTLANNLQFISS